MPIRLDHTIFNERKESQDKIIIGICNSFTNFNKKLLTKAIFISIFVNSFHFGDKNAH